MVAVYGLELGQPFPLVANGDAGFQTMVVDDAGSDKIAMVFQMPAAMTITHIGACVTSYAGASKNYDFTLEGVTVTTGLPDGTPVASALSVGLSAAGFAWAALGTPYAATRGQWLAIVVKGSATGGPDGTNNATLGYALDNILEGGAGRGAFPLALTDTAAAGWVKNNNQYPCYGVKDASQAWGTPIESFTLRALGGADDGKRFVCKFTIPTTWCSTFKVAGIRLLTRVNTGSTIRLGLWNAAGTALQSIDIDDGLAGQLDQNYCRATLYFDEATLSTLSAGTTYYIGLERITTQVNIYSFEVAAASPDFTAFPGGSAFVLSQWTGSAWTETGYEKSRPLIGLLLEDLTVPTAGGGGLLTHPGMGGGLRG